MEAFDRRVLKFDSGLWPLRVLKFDGAFAPKVLRFDGPAGRGLWYRRFAAMSMYAVEVLHRTSKSAEVRP